MSSLLETFFILFDSDSAEVKKGADEAKKATDKLNKELNATDKVSQKLGGSFRDLALSAKNTILGILGTGALIAGIHLSAKYANELSELSRALNVNIEELSAWGDAVKKSGGTAEDFQSTVKMMTAHLADFATKGTSRIAPFFKELGISMVDSRGKARDFIDVLPEIADSFEKLGKQQSFGIGQKLGLDQGTIMLLQQGRREVDSLIKRQRELGVVTKEQGEIAVAYNSQLDDTTHAFRSLFIQIGSFILPTVTNFFKTFERGAVFFRENSEILVGGITAVAAALAYLLAPAIAAVVVTAAPFLLVGAAIAGVVAVFALLYEDFSKFDQGQGSLIGKIINKWPTVGKILIGISKAAQLFIEFIKNAFGTLFNIILRPLDAWSIFREAVNKGVARLIQVFPLIGVALDQMKQWFLKLGKFVTDVWDSIVFTITSAIESVKNAINSVVEFFGSVKARLGFGDEATIKTIATGQQAINNAATSPIAAQSSSSIANSSRTNNKNTTVQTGPITINTQAKNGKEVGSALGGSLEKQLRQATSNFDDGVLA